MFEVLEMPSITVALPTEILWRFEQTAREIEGSTGRKASRNQLIKDTIRDGVELKKLRQEPKRMLKQSLTLLNVPGELQRQILDDIIVESGLDE